MNLQPDKQRRQQSPARGNHPHSANTGVVIPVEAILLRVARDQMQTSCRNSTAERKIPFRVVALTARYSDIVRGLTELRSTPQLSAKSRQKRGLFWDGRFAIKASEMLTAEGTQSSEATTKKGSGINDKNDELTK